MADFTITVDANDEKIIRKIATKSGVGPRQMLEQHISNWAHGQIEGFFMNKIRNKTTQELINLLGDIQ